MVVCPKCATEMEEGSTDIAVFIKNKEVGVLEDVKVISCPYCTHAMLELKVEMTTKGIYIQGS